MCATIFKEMDVKMKLYRVSQKLYLILTPDFGVVHFSVTNMLVRDMYKSFGT